MHLGIAHLSNAAIEKLILAQSRDNQRSGKEMTEEEKEIDRNHRLQGFYSYDMLLLSKNARKYEYLPNHYPDRSKFAMSEHTEEQKRIRSLDTVRLAVDLAYMKRDDSISRLSILC